MEQAYRLLRAQCAYCHSFRMARKELHRYSCMLRLLQFGLIREAYTVDAIGEKEVLGGLVPDGAGEEMDDDDLDDEEDAVSLDRTTKRREAYVRKVLQEHGHKARLDEIRRGKHEGASEMRRNLVKEFLAAIIKDKICRSCSGVAPVYRKDRFVKIFETELTTKDKAKMAQAGKKRTDVLLVAKRISQKRDESALDEGIADLDLSSDELDQGEDGEDGEDGEEDGEDLDENGDVVMSDAGLTKKTKALPESRPDRYINPQEVLGRLNRLFEKEQDVLSLLYRSTPPHKSSKPLTADMFFLQTLLVPPNRFRPEAKMADQEISEAQQNNLYRMIMRNSALVAQISRELTSTKAGSNGRTRDMASLHQAWTQLQETVNALVDRNKNPIQGAAGKRNEEGIKQKLEKKEGLFRNNMMGKRVNYAARTV